MINNVFARRRMYYEEGEDNLYQTGQKDGLFIDTLSARLNGCWLSCKNKKEKYWDQSYSLFLIAWALYEMGP